MATTPHSTLTGADLHEPKGVASASARSVYVADGAGSGSWQALPAGDAKVNAASSGVLTTPTVYTPIGTALSSNGGSIGNEVTELNFKLTYTGSLTRSFRISYSVGVSHDDASSRDISVAIAINSVVQPAFEQVVTAAQNVRVPVSGSAFFTLADNDFVEAMVKVPAGDLTVYTPYVLIEGLPE